MLLGMCCCSVNVKMMLLAVLTLCLVAPSWQAIPSPCPGILEYEDKNDYPGRLYGKVMFPKGSPHWLFMTIALDQKADMLGNWLGEVTTNDNTRFRINNPEIKTSREPLRFFIKYDIDNEAVPKVQQIKLEEIEICNAQRPFTIPPPVITPATTALAPVTVSPVQESFTTRQSSNPVEFDFKVPVNYYTANEKAQCGVVKLYNPVALIKDGAPTFEGQWPWQVALYRTKWVNHNYICGGTLVSHRHVITAAHCTTVRGTKPAQTVDYNSLTVYLGKHDLITSTRGVQIRFVEKVTIYPDYDATTFALDVSVLVLQEPVQYTDWVQPACLWPDQFIDLQHVIGESGSVVGWGSDGTGKLLLVEMPVVSQDTCIRSKGDFFLRVTSDYTFCAGNRNGASPCNGDSGGGMVFKINNIWHLRGVVSIALSKENEAVCDPSHYVVFTDLAKFLPWIRQNIDPY